jgi:hypothetical protein
MVERQRDHDESLRGSEPALTLESGVRARVATLDKHQNPVRRGLARKFVVRYNIATAGISLGRGAASNAIC